MSCNNERIVPYAKIAGIIEDYSKGKIHWEGAFTTEVDADYNIWLDCNVERVYSGNIVLSQSLTIIKETIFDKLTGLETYAISFDSNTLISLFNK